MAAHHRNISYELFLQIYVGKEILTNSSKTSRFILRNFMILNDLSTPVLGLTQPVYHTCVSGTALPHHFDIVLFAKLPRRRPISQGIYKETYRIKLWREGKPSSSNLLGVLKCEEEKYLMSYNPTMIDNVMICIIIDRF